MGFVITKGTLTACSCESILSLSLCGYKSSFPFSAWVSEMFFLGYQLLQICISCSPNSHIYLYSDSKHMILKISKFYFKFYTFKIKLVKTLLFDIYVISYHFMSFFIVLVFIYAHWLLCMCVYSCACRCTCVYVHIHAYGSQMTSSGLLSQLSFVLVSVL